MGRSDVQTYSWLYSKFKSSLNKKREKEKKEGKRRERKGREVEEMGRGGEGREERLREVPKSSAWRSLCGPHTLGFKSS